MKPAALSLVFALAAGPVLASPLSDALDAAGGALCFTGIAPAPSGQSWRQARLSLTREAAWDGAPTLRLRLEGKGKPVMIYGVCSWLEDINRGVGGRVLDPTFLPTTGVTCFMVTDVTGASAEEGGSFPMDWGGDGQVLQFHLPEIVAAWRSYDTGRAAQWPKVKPADRIVRVQRTGPEACAELRTRFAPAKP